MAARTRLHRACTALAEKSAKIGPFLKNGRKIADFSRFFHDFLPSDSFPAVSKSDFSLKNRPKSAIFLSLPIPCRVDFRFELNVGLVLDVDFVLDVQVAIHLKGLAQKAKLNERHVQATRVFKAKVASLTSERTELQERVQRMTEEIEKLKYDLKHTMSARARAESREDEV